MLRHSSAPSSFNQPTDTKSFPSIPSFTFTEPASFPKLNYDSVMDDLMFPDLESLFSTINKPIPPAPPALPQFLLPAEDEEISDSRDLMEIETDSKSILASSPPELTANTPDVQTPEPPQAEKQQSTEMEIEFPRLEETQNQETYSESECSDSDGEEAEEEQHDVVTNIRPIDLLNDGLFLAEFIADSGFLWESEYLIPEERYSSYRLQRVRDAMQSKPIVDVLV